MEENVKYDPQAEEKAYVVVVCHQNDSAKYVFGVPEGVTLKAGDILLVDTRSGKGQVGYCATPSFYITDELLRRFYGTRIDKLKNVNKKLIAVDFDKKVTRFDSENDNIAYDIKGNIYVVTKSSKDGKPDTLIGPLRKQVEMMHHSTV